MDKKDTGIIATIRKHPIWTFSIAIFAWLWHTGWSFVQSWPSFFGPETILQYIKRKGVVAMIGQLPWSHIAVEGFVIAVFLLVLVAVKRGRSDTPLAWNEKMERVTEHTYTNERVLLDGKQFVGCVFEKVKLVYNGTGNFELINCTFHVLNGDIQITTDSKAIAPIVFLLMQMSGLQGVKVNTGVIPNSVII